MDDKGTKLRIYGSLAAGLIAFGFAPILVRAAEGYHPVVVAGYRTVFAALCLIPFWLADLRKNRKDKAEKATHEPRKEWMAVLAGFFLSVHFILWISSITLTSVASASVLVAIHPIILIIAESLFLKRRFAGFVWLGVIISFLGSASLGFADHGVESHMPNPVLGDILAVAAAFVFVLYFLIGQQLRQSYSWIQYVFRVYGYTAIFTAIIILLGGFDWTPEPRLILVGLGLAIGPQIMGHGSMNFAVKYISPTLLGSLILVEPIIATFLALIFFAEFPTIMAIIAMFITLGGVILAWFAGRKKKQPA